MQYETLQFIRQEFVAAINAAEDCVARCRNNERSSVQRVGHRFGGGEPVLYDAADRDMFEQRLVRLKRLRDDFESTIASHPDLVEN